MNSRPKDDNSKETIHWQTPKVILDAVANYYKDSYVFDPFPFRHSDLKRWNGLTMDWEARLLTDIFVQYGNHHPFKSFAFYSNPPYYSKAKKLAWRQGLKSGMQGMHLLPTTILGGELDDEMMKDRGKGAGFGIRIIKLKRRVNFYGESIKTGQIINASKKERTDELIFEGKYPKHIEFVKKRIAKDKIYKRELYSILSKKGKYSVDVITLGYKENGYVTIRKKYITQPPTFYSMLIEVRTGKPFIFEPKTWDWKNEPIPQIK